MDGWMDGWWVDGCDGWMMMMMMVVGGGGG